MRYKIMLVMSIFLFLLIILVEIYLYKIRQRYFEFLEEIKVEVVNKK
ncbi:MAG: hypothetical protein LBF97_07595 [Elusimicrobiota bacterium]|nr:hypothetical protein [Elusimicrobiota bacterium]